MSPQQTAQLRLRLEKVAELRVQEQIKAAIKTCAKPAKRPQLPVTDKLAVTGAAKPVTDKPVTDKLVTDKPAGNGRDDAKKQAAYRQRKGEALKTVDAERKRASRAKKASA